MKTRHLFLALLTCLASINVSAEIGTWTDENGTTWRFEYNTYYKTAYLYYNYDESGTLTPCISGTIPAELIIPASVYVNDVAYAITSIGYGAFQGATNLTSVTIPEGVTRIGDVAFYGCSSLTSITIPEGVTTIGGHAFYCCSSLTSINIPEGVTSIGWGAFSGCSNLTSINIPEGVTSISGYAFYNCSNLTSVTLPEGVTSISEQAFYGCSSLTSINIPEGVTTLGDGAFRDCCSLTSINIPEGVTTIGTEAFYGCSSLTSVTIPEGVTSIGYYAFSYCASLTTINIPNGVTSIGNSAFYGCSSLTNVTIPEGVTSIGEYSFYGCSSLTSVTIPEEVTTIGDYAFYCCSSLTNVTIPEGVTSIGEYSFYGCSSLTSITIPKGVTTICEGAFDWCWRATSIIIPKGVTTIGERAFSGCSSLTSITIPEGVTTIGNKAFRDCSSLTSITIPEGVTTIGNNAFENCSSLTSITIPESVTSIGSAAFSGCSSLTSVTIPESVTTINYATFEGCTSLTTINIPNGVTTIGDRAFCDCSSLTSINIPEGVTSIGSEAFSGCSSLTNITIPEGVTTINDATFHECSSLTSITIPEGVTSIGHSAFRDCSSLTSVTIPKEVTSISWVAFAGCNSLTAIKLEMGTPIEIDGDTFYEFPQGNATLYVPKGSKAAYEAAEVWRNFGAIIEYDYLEVDQPSIAVGGSTTVEIGLNNFDLDLVAFQMDLTLPEGVSLDKTGCSLSSRITDEEQVLTIGKLKNGAYRLTSYSLSLKPISERSGTLLTLKLTATEDCDDAQATISNIRFSTAGSKRITMPDETFDIDILREFKLTYMIDGEVYKTSTVAYGTELTAEDVPTKEGYTFSGWSEIPETMPAKDVTVTGTFSVNSYTLTYTVDGEVYKTSTVAYGTELTAEAAPTKEGYTFSGWSEIPETMPAKDVTVTGTFSVNSYTLTYIVDGEVYKTSTVAYGTELTAEATPTKEGYTFSGWSEIPETMPAQDVTVTGSFSVNSYTLTYTVDGEVYKTSTVAYGTELTAEAAPTKEGYTFSGWSEIPETMPAKDVTVTGTFSVNSYTLTYIVDGEVYKTSTVAYGTELTAEAAPTKEGYTFSGWSEIPETMPAKDVTVTGTFSVNSYTLTYTVDGEVYKTSTVAYGTELTAEDAPTKEGYTFSGWSEIPESMPAKDVTVTGTFTIIDAINSVIDSEVKPDGKYIEKGRVVIYRSGRKYSAAGVLLK